MKAISALSLLQVHLVKSDGRQVGPGSEGVCDPEARGDPGAEGRAPEIHTPFPRPPLHEGIIPSLHSFAYQESLHPKQHSFSGLSLLPLGFLCPDSEESLRSPYSSSVPHL